MQIRPGPLGALKLHIRHPELRSDVLRKYESDTKLLLLSFITFNIMSSVSLELIHYSASLTVPRLCAGCPPREDRPMN